MRVPFLVSLCVFVILFLLYLSFKPERLSGREGLLAPALKKLLTSLSFLMIGYLRARVKTLRSRNFYLAAAPISLSG